MYVFLKYTVLVTLHQMCLGRGNGLVSEVCGCLHEEEDTIACYQGGGGLVSRYNYHAGVDVGWIQSYNQSDNSGKVTAIYCTHQSEIGKLKSLRSLTSILSISNWKN